MVGENRSRRKWGGIRGRDKRGMRGGIRERDERVGCERGMSGKNER